MSNNDSPEKKSDKTSIKERRLLQFDLIKQWENGLISGKDCIEEIVQLEKILFINPEIIKLAKEKYEE